uniref:Ubiquitin-like protease family profile domain-containing protein n=1 Tax=Solanum lycopersicum TaxID=4081 RepID=A0A3Q7G5J1_SOLLC
MYHKKGPTTYYVTNCIKTLFSNFFLSPFHILMSSPTFNTPFFSYILMKSRFFVLDRSKIGQTMNESSTSLRITRGRVFWKIKTSSTRTNHERVEIKEKKRPYDSSTSYKKMPKPEELKLYKEQERGNMLTLNQRIMILKLSDLMNFIIMRMVVRYICKNREKRTIHMQCYTQINTLNELQNKLPPNQYNRICASSCFTQLTPMRRCHVQAQLFRCIMLRKLEGSSVNAILFYINGTTLRFTIREFVIISGLNCSDNAADFYFDTDQPNRIIDEYFPGNSPVTKARLAEAFKAKVWGDNQEDAYKFGILYYIHEFIMSAEPTTTTIDRLNFDLVETGRFMDYSWGRKAFNELDKSINNKIKSCGQYYRIQGFPLPMQVWFYECCSYVEDKIVVKVSSHIPRIINWVTKNNHPRFDYFMKIIFNDADNPISSTKAIKTYTRRSMARKATPSQSININSVAKHSDVATSHNNEHVEQKSVQDRTQMGQIKKSTSITISRDEFEAFKKSVKDEFADLRKMLEDKFKTVLEAMNSKVNVVVMINNQPSEIFITSPHTLHINSKVNLQLGDNLHELNQNSPLLDQVILGDNLNDVSGTASQDQLVLYANVDAQQNTQRETESSSNSWVIYNIYNAASHERIAEAEESIIVAAPIQMVYMPDSNQETVITESQDELPDHLLPSVNTLQNIVLQKQVEAEVTPMPAVRHRHPGPFNISPYMTSFGSDAGSSSRQPVVFYMKHPFVSLSDKEESDLFSNFWIWLKRTYSSSITKKGRLHWILIVISFNDRCIKVYDSIKNSLHHSIVVNHIKKYAQLIPMYLVKSDFYLKKGVDIASHHRYQGHTIYDSFEIVYVEDLPQQPAASLDCGVYVASYAEFLSERKDIPADLNPEEIRLRYGALFDSEAPLKFVRIRTENNSSERITIH